MQRVQSPAQSEGGVFLQRARKGLQARLRGKHAGMHTSGSEHESSFMIRLMRESGSSCRGIDFEFCARVAVEVREGCDHLGRVQCRLRRCVTTCSDSCVSHKWCILSTCLWSFGGSVVGSVLFLDVFAGSSTRWPRTVGLGAKKLTNVLGSAGRRPPSSPKVGTHTRALNGGGRSVGGAIFDLRVVTKYICVATLVTRPKRTQVLSGASVWYFWRHICAI